LTINGDGSHPVVINIPAGQAALFHAPIVLTGGITDDQVLFNVLGSTGGEIKGGAGINGQAVHGIIVGIDRKFNMDNMVTEGHLYGGGTSDFQLVSNIRNLITPITITNQATLTSGGTTLTASAGITISFNASLPQTAAGTAAAQWAAGQYALGGLRPGVYYVAVDGLSGARAAAEQARIADAIAGLNAEFGRFGVTLVEVDGAGAARANVHIRVADTTALGDAGEGVLGLWAVLSENQLAFVEHPQLWLIPFALTVLAAEHLNRDRLGRSQRNGIHYAALTLVYLASTAETFLIGLGRDAFQPVVLVVLSLAGVFLGMLLRVRAFLFLGSVFLLLCVTSWRPGSCAGRGGAGARRATSS
jgi:hypothetical protein